MLCVILVSLAIVTLLSAVFIRNNGSNKSDQLLLMLCETGERSLDYYFDSVQSSVLKVTSYVEDDLEGIDDEHLAKNVEDVQKYFDAMVSKTKGVLTYYYRIDPSVSSTVKGFWYTNLSGEGFEEHEVTDITLYDVEDTSKLVWFTVPKHEGKPIWLPPYITDNLDVRVISYDAPVYYEGRFVGVIGIEVDYSTMAKVVDSIRLYDNGYAFLSDSEGNIFYHPYINVTDQAADISSEIPGSTSAGTLVRYDYNGKEKVAVWLPLSNGMCLNVTVPVSETEGDWQKMILSITMGAVAVLLISSMFLMFYTRRITRPLEQLTEAAEQVDKGNYNYFLSYDQDDELGRLTRTFKNLADHVKDHISNLNEQVYIDALTNVKNKGAFTKAVEELQNEIENGNENPEFAIGAFDCDNLKVVNDRNGHEKGDAFLVTACHTISNIFKHSPVFRVGGDEFTVILRDEDYRNMESLIEEFDRTSARINASVKTLWEQVRLSKGFAVYDPSCDRSVTDVMRRADKLMYENKQERKELSVNRC